ncbi:MAG: metal-sensitive transcriptional regulator [Moraxellaceae bacterium]|nr:metal-sensitive transcriptional regulator [Pseudobdellovibrionaceae bacterium]
MAQSKTKKSSSKQAVPAHDHSAEIKRINRIKGQIEGMERMIVQKRYCPEIVIQIKAIRSALKSLEANIIENHMLHCVKDAIKSKDAAVVQQKLDEIISLFKSQT